MQSHKSPRSLLAAAVVMLAVAAMLAGCGAKGADAGPAWHAEVAAAMDQKVPALMAESGTVGLMVALVDGDQVVWKRGFGMADAAAGVPVTPQTMFHIGSVSKTMTALAVMQLVEQGKVDLDAPLSTYVPNFRQQPPGATDAITVRTVLDHHSGIPGDVFNGLFTTGEPNPGYTAWLQQMLSQVTPERPVNTMWAYNNSGYVLLGELVANVSGMSLAQYARAHIFGPAGMPTATFDDAAVSAERLTGNYSVTAQADGSVGQPTAQPREYINGHGAGSVTASADDMSQYLSMLLAGGQGPGGRIVADPTLQRMWTPQIVTPLDILYFEMGLGFALGAPPLNWAGKVVQHDGATTWNSSMLQLLPDSDLGVFVGINTSGPQNISASVAALALSLAYSAKTGTPVPPDATLPASAPGQGAAQAVAGYTGRYASGNNLARVAVDGAGQVSWTRELGAPTQETVPLTLREDGWWDVGGTTTAQVQFRTVEGRRLIVSRIPWGPGTTDVVSGELVPDVQVPAAWTTRVGMYVPVDADPRETEPFQNPSANLTVVEGALVLELPSELGRQVLLPVSDDVAYTYGIGGALGRNKGDMVQAVPDGFRYLGVTYQRV